jgi:ferredoxin
MLHEPAPVGETRRSKRPWREIRPGPVYSRREMFSLFKDRAAEAVAGTAEDHEASAEYAAPGITERRKIFIDALGVIKNRGNENNNEGEVEVKALKINEGSFPAHNIGILEGCTFCDACDAFCPTGAIKKVENDDNGSISYEFNGANCVGCYECRELCPESAIYYKGEIEVGRFADAGAETLIMRQRKRCTVCGIIYIPASDNDDCPRCIRRKSLDKRVRETIFGA